VGKGIGLGYTRDNDRAGGEATVNPGELTPVEYELQVKEYIESHTETVDEFRVTHLEKLAASDGEFEIDIVARFRFLGISWLAIIECKRYSRPIERKIVMELKAKRDALGADKAILFATSTFQTGAIEYAQRHRIALCHFQKVLVECFSTHTPYRIDYPIYVFDGIDAHGQKITRERDCLFDMLAREGAKR